MKNLITSALKITNVVCQDINIVTLVSYGKSGFETEGFEPEHIVDMKIELERFKAELDLSKRSITSDWNRKARLENKLANDIKCLTQNIWPELMTVNN